DLSHPAFLFARNLVDEREKGLLDELDQALEHLRLAAEMPVERSFRHLELRRERRRRHLLRRAVLEHVCERRKYLGLSFPGPRHRAPDHESCGSARRNSLRFPILKST